MRIYLYNCVVTEFFSLKFTYFIWELLLKQVSGALSTKLQMKFFFFLIKSNYLSIITELLITAIGQVKN